MGLPLNFAYNPTSWKGGAPIEGGMADRLIQPILPHLESNYITTDCPLPGYVNVYYTFRKTYGLNAKPVGERSVFISHGIADKNWRNTNKMIHKGGFNYAFVSGPAWTKRLRRDNFSKRRIVEVGYTKLDPIFNGEVESAWPAEAADKIKVLWAPTHGGGGEPVLNKPRGSAGALRSTHWNRDLILDLLDSPEFFVMEALHPRHHPQKQATFAEYVGADVVIADGGSTIYESWALGLPVVFPSWLVGKAMTFNRETFEADIYRQQVGRHADLETGLARLVEDAANEGITSAEVEFVEDIFPEQYRGISGRLHANALDEIMTGVQPARSLSNFSTGRSISTSVA